MDTIKTQCSGCLDDVTVTIVTDGSGRDALYSFRSATVTARKPSNGLRGSKHVPALDVETEALLEPDSVLLLWDCPLCGYADSTYADAETRAALT